MAKWVISGDLSNYTNKLSALVASADEDIKRAIYPGAKVVMDAVKAEAQALPVQTQNSYNKKGLRTGISTKQKAGIIEGLGIATMRNDNGVINAKIGLDGYNSQVTEKYPNGQPNAMIASRLSPVHRSVQRTNLFPEHESIQKQSRAGNGETI